MEEYKYPKVETLEETPDGAFARYRLAPVERNMAGVLGNSLRRVLLSSIPGAAVTALEITSLPKGFTTRIGAGGTYAITKPVPHEFSTIPGVVEDVTEILLNLKDVKIRLEGEAPRRLMVKTEEGAVGPVTAGELIRDPEILISNPEQVLFTLNGEEDGSIQLELRFDRGVGYRRAQQNKALLKEEEERLFGSASSVLGQHIGLIPVDSVFNPIERVRYEVEPVDEEHEALILELVTDGTVKSGNAMQYAAWRLMCELEVFSSEENFVTEKDLVEEEEEEEPEKNPALEFTVEEFNFPKRVYHCLKRAEIDTAEQLVNTTADELLEVRNFGEQSLIDVKEKLAEYDLCLKGEAPED